jgi:hypothetical protein
MTLYEFVSLVGAEAPPEESSGCEEVADLQEREQCNDCLLMETEAEQEQCLTDLFPD